MEERDIKERRKYRTPTVYVGSSTHTLMASVMMKYSLELLVGMESIIFLSGIVIDYAKATKMVREVAVEKLEMELGSVEYN